MKVLLAVDGSYYTDRMLEHIASHADLLGPRHEYVALTVVPPLPAHAARFLSADVIDRYHAEQAEAVLAPVRAFAQQQGWKLETRWVIGHPAEQIAQAGNDGDVGLVVIGIHGHGALGTLVMGSTANRVVALTKVPVLLVR